MKTGLFQLPGEVSKISSMSNRSVRLVVDSNEDMSDEQLQKTMSLLGKFGWFCFLAEEPLELEDALSLPEIKREKTDKSPSVRLRNTLWIYWNEKKPTEDFDSFYLKQMEKFIDVIKEKLT